MILWPEPDFSKRGKRKQGEQESQHHSVNECATSHNTSLGHDQGSPSRPGWVRSGLSGHTQWGPREPAAPGHCFHCWMRKSLLPPPGICWVNPDISQPLLLPSPAVPVWRRAAGDPVRPYIFQKEPFGCQQEDSTLIVTQESLISWEKTLIAASSAPGCRWHGFHQHHHPQHASGTSAICFQFWMSKCLTGEVLGNAFFPLHLLIWLSKNGKKTSREIREEVWGLNNSLMDSIPLQKLGILLA